MTTEKQDDAGSQPGEVALERTVGRPAPERCTSREKCQGEATRYDTVSSGVYSLTLKCRTCGFIVRHDWD